MPLDAAFAQLSDHPAQAPHNETMPLGPSHKFSESQLLPDLTNGTRHVVLDMASLTYMDSAGLGFLVLINAELTNQGGTLVLRDVNQRIRELLHLTRTDAILQFDA